MRWFHSEGVLVLLVDGELVGAGIFGEGEVVGVI